jgi:hypothetical protein
LTGCAMARSQRRADFLKERKNRMSDRVVVLIRRPDSAPTKPRSDGREDRFHHVHVIRNA